MPAIDSFHMRARLVSDLGTRMGRQLIGGWLQAETQPPAQHTGDRYQRYLRECSAPYLTDQIKVAESFYITDDMLTLAEHAAQSMPNQWINREDLPAEAGFLWLPRPIAHFDIRGRQLRTRALSWHQFQGGIVLLHWTDRDDLEDDINVRLMRMWDKDGPEPDEAAYEVGLTPQDAAKLRGSSEWSKFPKLQLQHAQPDAYGGRMGMSPDCSNLHRWRKMLGVAFVPHYEGEEMFPVVEGDTRAASIGWSLDPDVGTEENRVHAQRLLVMNPPEVDIIDPISATFAAFCRLCQQSITIAEKEPVDRVSRRRSRNLPNNESVTVINLRHASHRKQDGETDVEWSHRWLRRGHWRRQWYGSGEDRHQAPVWIHETVCGPEDKPLVIREHVTNLMR